MNTPIHIYRVQPADAERLCSISIETFTTAFAADNTAANMQAYIDTNFTTEKLINEIAHPQSAFYFAMQGDAICGYCKLNTGTAQTEIKDDTGAELERIYVLPAYQGQHVGKLLFHHCMQQARQQGKSYLWLGVWEHNAKAIRFYQAQGMQVFDKHIFMVGDDAQTDVMMKLAL